MNSYDEMSEVHLLDLIEEFLTKNIKKFGFA
jgi:hypothetical protein